MTGGSQRKQAEGRRWVHRRVEGPPRNKRAADVFFLKHRNIKAQLSPCIVCLGVYVCVYMCVCIGSFLMVSEISETIRED